MNLVLVIRSTEWNFENSPQFVQHAIKTIIQLHGSDMNDAPAFVIHRANLLAQKWGTAHP